MMNMTVTTNNLVGATKEPWFNLKGKELIAHMRTQREAIVKMVENVFEEDRCAYTL
jgi:putative heme iron utilization protein